MSTETTTASESITIHSYEVVETPQPVRTRKRNTVEDENLARVLEIVRVVRGLSRRDLSEKADISYAYLSEIENGHRFTTEKTLNKILNALEIPAEAFKALCEQDLKGDILIPASTGAHQ